MTPGGGGGATTGACRPGVPATSQLPRLTNAQYESTVLDLVGVPGAASTLAPDTEAVDQRAWDGYVAAAQAIAAQVLAEPALKARLVTCEPAGDGSACAAQIVESFGQRAFRRPLTSEELARFNRLYAERASITESGTFEQALELIVRSFLLSPSFLLRAEVSDVPEGPYYALSGYEVASRLSYLLIGSMPDAALFAAAAAGALATPAQIREHALRLLEQDPRARTTVGAFHERYLHKGPGTRWAEYQRDPALFPSFSSEVPSALSEETDRFFDYVVFEQRGSFRDILTSPVAFVNASTAPLYGLDAAAYGAELEQVTLDASVRPGIFTRAGFLASHALYNRPSPILRGAFLQKYVLCSPVGAPPPGAEGTPLPEVSATASNRERVTAQTAAPGCAACHHQLINPAGFVLEGFDAVGARQPTDPFSGAPVDTAVKLSIGGQQRDIEGPVELFDAIAASPESSLCYARAWVTAAFARQLTDEDLCVAEQLGERLTRSGYRVLDLIADLTQAESFRVRAVAPEVQP